MKLNLFNLKIKNIHYSTLLIPVANWQFKHTKQLASFCFPYLLTYLPTFIYI